MKTIEKTVKPELPKSLFITACKLSIQSANIDTFNHILQEGLPIEDMKFVPETLRDIANQLDKLITGGE